MFLLQALKSSTERRLPTEIGRRISEGRTGSMKQQDLETTKRYYRSFMEWAQVCVPMKYMAMGLRTASKDEIVGLIREWAETITRKDP